MKTFKVMPTYRKTIYAPVCFDVFKVKAASAESARDIASRIVRAKGVEHILYVHADETLLSRVFGTIHRPVRGSVGIA